MEGSVQKEIVQPTEKTDANLHQNVGKQLKPLGHTTSTIPDAEAAIPITEELREIGVDTKHIVGSKFEELMTGEGGSTSVRVTESKGPLHLLKEKFFKKQPK